MKRRTTNANTIDNVLTDEDRSIFAQDYQTNEDRPDAIPVEWLEGLANSDAYSTSFRRHIQSAIDLWRKGANR